MVVELLNAEASLQSVASTSGFLAVSMSPFLVERYLNDDGTALRGQVNVTVAALSFLATGTLADKASLGGFALPWSRLRRLIFL